MKTVATYGNLAEAGFAGSLLESVGIRNLLADEQSFLLNPGIAMSGIRLQVEDEDFERATLVLKNGPDALTPRAEGLSEEVPRARDRIPLGLFYAGALILIVLAVVIQQLEANRRSAPMQGADTTREYDDNHDGRPDHFVTYHNRRLASVTMDRNGDGKIDKWETFDREGVIEHMEVDQNFDGRPDVWQFYENGKIVSSRLDVDFNGRPDWFETFENGIIVRADCRPNEAEHVVRRYIYEHGVLREEWVDEDQDGFFDYKVLIDPFGARSERIPVHSPN